MKLYPNRDTLDKYNIDALETYKYKENNTTLVWSSEGVIQIHKNKMNRLQVVDIPIQTLRIGNIEFTCDESKFIVDCEWFQIPTKHIIEKVNKTFYRLREGALVELVVETSTYHDSMEIANTNTIPLVQIYFVLKNNLLSHGVEEDIHSFLDILKSNSS